MFSTLKALHQIPRHTPFNREPRELREKKNRIPFRVLGVFRGSPSVATTPSELFSFSFATQRRCFAPKRWAE
jgi:hypothetical protein